MAETKKVQHEWGVCDSCGWYRPLWPESDMCGPCTTGDASTLLDESHDQGDGLYAEQQEQDNG